MKPLKRKKIVAFSLSLSGILSGLFIYSFLRESPPLLGNIYRFFGLKPIIESSKSHFLHMSFPDWVLYGLPDLLWMFSFFLMLLIVWNFRINSSSIIWIVLSLVVGFGFEFLQLKIDFLGVFDPMDLLYLLFGVLLAFAFTIKIEKHAFD